MRITIFAQDWQPLEPLLEAYAGRGVEVQRISTDMPDAESLQRAADESDALLVVGSRKRSPRTALPGPVMERGDGTVIPAAWLPDVGAEKLRRFAETAARLHQREAATQPFAVLSQWHPQYLRLAGRIESLLHKQHKPVYRWTSDIVYRDDMARGLRAGLAAAVYVGHGRPVGWVGYYGTRIQHLQDIPGEPLGALLSLCCRTASRRRTPLSFSEAVPLSGVAGAAFGAVGPTLHLNNTRWAVAICSALQTGVRSIGELIVKALPPNLDAVADYRLMGDPLSPLLGTEAALAEAEKIAVYA